MEDVAITCFLKIVEYSGEHPRNYFLKPAKKSPNFLSRRKEKVIKMWNMSEKRSNYPNFLGLWVAL